MGWGHKPIRARFNNPFTFHSGDNYIGVNSANVICTINVNMACTIPVYTACGHLQIVLAVLSSILQEHSHSNT